MEDSDNIIFPILKDIGCELPPDITSIKQIEHHIYAVAVSCLNAIDPEKCSTLDRQLPPNKASRFRVATTVATILKSMGFQGELGYQSFLYPHEQEIRKIISFLLERLPRSESNDIGGYDNGGNSIQMRIHNAIQNTVNNTKRNFTILDKIPKSNKLSTPNIPFQTASYIPLVKIDNTQAKLQRLIQEQFKTTNTNQIYFNQQSKQQHFWATQQPQYNTLSSTTKQSTIPSQMIPSVLNTNTIHLLQNKRDEEKLNPQFQQQHQAMQQQLSAHITSSFRQAFQDSELQQQLYNEKKLKRVDLNKVFNDDSVFARKAQFTQENAVAITMDINEQTGLTKEEQMAKEEEEYQLLVKQREDELTALQQQYQELQQQYKNMTNNIISTTDGIKDLKQQTINLAKQVEELEAQYKTRQHIIDFLPNAAENIEKLKQLTNNNMNKILKLNIEWEKVRDELISEFHSIQQQYNEKQALYNNNVDRLQRLRNEIKTKGQDIREKEEQYKIALAEYEAMPKSINRNIYIKRIMDIVTNIDKQNDEIGGILGDIKQVQRELVNKNESVKRSFSEADDLIYSTAKNTKSSIAISIYKDVIKLRDGCNQIVENVEGIGKKQNNIRELEQTIELIKDRGTLDHVGTVLDDLNAIKEENDQLKRQLKKSKK